MLETEIGKTGEVIVEGHAIGRLDGFMFAPDASAAGSEAKALNAAAQKALAGEIEARATQAVAGAQRSDRAGERRRACAGSATPVGKLDRRRRRAAPARAHPRRRASDRAGARTGADAARSLAQDAYREAAGAAVLARAPPTTSPAWRAASPSSWSRRSACWSARRSPRRSRGSTSRRARRCANTACASAPITSTCRSCSSRRRARSRRSSGRSSTRAPDAKGVDELLHLAASGRTSIPVDKETPKPLYRTAGYRVVRRARGARRYSGAARRSDPPGAVLARGRAARRSRPARSTAAASPSPAP